ncbi:DoxX family protein [Ornithinimicrobium cryptoxanthini]|uniref:DoxX family protein n=1 Tax=Ornithinimicrobium cryptoxanthini TaxID=2934161 RepID=A0ABY4YI90_9MICO|nr:DoxX family protein [Ornithinimicrobium cryptoxanthini]USQ75980.1 DoxX family protein [Ornithinimicrobium cryptoxanthini]
MQPKTLPLVIVPFAVSGVIHLVKPETFEPIIPTPLRPWARDLVLVSGVAELACAAGLLHPRTRPAAGLASAALLLAVWPANAQMSVDLGRRAQRRRDPRSWASFALSLGRLPLQVPMIRAAWRAWQG